MAADFHASSGTFTAEKAVEKMFGVAMLADYEFTAEKAVEKRRWRRGMRPPRFTAEKAVEKQQQRSCRQLCAYSTRSRTPFRSDGGQHSTVMADAVPG